MLFAELSLIQWFGNESEFNKTRNTVKTKKTVLSLVALAMAFAANGAPTDNSAKGNNFTGNQYGELIEQIGDNLMESFVFPTIAPKYVDALEQCVISDCLSGVEDTQLAAKKLTTLLQDVYADKHLKVFAPGQRAKMKQKRMKKVAKAGKNKASKMGIQELDVLDGNIGYIAINGFPGSEASVLATRKAMIKLKDTSAIIFDIRQHGGGRMDEISEIASFLFTEPTHMVTMRSPHNNDGKPDPHISSPNDYATHYQNKPIYVLTSDYSASAAEHFAMSMKSTGRAILIGETTAGYGHWGGIFPIANDFELFVPVGRTYHPKTELGWESFGITPDIQIKATESLDYALKRIRTLS